MAGYQLAHKFTSRKRGDSRLMTVVLIFNQNHVELGMSVETRGVRYKFPIHRFPIIQRNVGVYQIECLVVESERKLNKLLIRPSCEGRVSLKIVWSSIILVALIFGLMSGATSSNFASKAIDLSGANPVGTDVDEPLVFSTLTGLCDYDEIVKVGLDNAGNIYVIGLVRELINDDYDINCFLYKINGSDFSLIYEIIFGGSSGASATDMFVDPSGKVYVTGHTNSPDFPVKNAFCDKYHNSTDCFIICFDIDGEILFSTYLGGEGGFGGSGGESIFVDDEGSIYVTGYTHSSDFPLLNSLSNRTGYSDVFVTKFNSTGNGLLYSSLIGGEDADTGLALTVDSQGVAYIAGVTVSEDFPTISALDYSPNDVADFGPNEGFVFALNTSGNGLVFSTYVGGSDSEVFYDIQLNAEGNVWVCGFTESNDFPTRNSYQDHGGLKDGIIFELASNGSTLLFSTFLGGQSGDTCYSMEFDERDNLFVTGTAYADEFPLVRAQKSLYDNYWYPNRDCFVMKINPEKTILYSTFVGGDSGDSGRSIAVDENGAAIVGGYTSSDDFPTRRELSEKYIDRYGDGFLFVLLDISDEDGDNIPNWWETANGYDPLNPEAPLLEVLTWYAPTILTIGVVTSMTIIILWFGRHRIRSGIGRVVAHLDARASSF